MKRKPIKRSGYMIALSRDHHVGLLFCWKIKEGLKKDVTFNRIGDYVRYFWEAHLKLHLIEEEILLFNQLQSELTVLAKFEHELLAALIDRIVSNDRFAKEEYLDLAQKLTDHIRFEEREVFPFLETALPAKTLAGVSGILTKLHTVLTVDNYPDEFWLKKN